MFLTALIGSPVVTFFGVRYVVYGLATHKLRLLMYMYGVVVFVTFLMSGAWLVAERKDGRLQHNVYFGAFVCASVMGLMAFAGFGFVGYLAEHFPQKIVQAAMSVLCVLVLAPAAIAMPLWSKSVDHDAITVAVLSGCTAVGIITLIWLRLHQQVFRPVGQDGISAALFGLTVGCFALLFVLLWVLPAHYALAPVLKVLCFGLPFFLVAGLWLATSALDNSGKFVLSLAAGVYAPAGA